MGGLGIGGEERMAEKYAEECVGVKRGSVGVECVCVECVGGFGDVSCAVCVPCAGSESAREVYSAEEASRQV